MKPDSALKAGASCFATARSKFQGPGRASLLNARKLSHSSVVAVARKPTVGDHTVIRSILRDIGEDDTPPHLGLRDIDDRHTPQSEYQEQDSMATRWAAGFQPDPEHLQPGWGVKPSVKTLLGTLDEDLNYPVLDCEGQGQDDDIQENSPYEIMSSLSRRACYKCGELGHHAEACSSPHRLCYNCKQPNHESNECPLPRSTEAKQCYHCQGLGHVQADCPTLRLVSAGTTGRCYNCGLPGHLMRNCPNPPTAGPAGPAGPVGVPRGAPMPQGQFRFQQPNRYPPLGQRPATCYKCGGPNHFARDCQAQSMKCYACGKLGHISRDCTAPNGGPLNTAGKICYNCSQAGHISRDCPEKAKPNGDAQPIQTNPDLSAAQSIPAPAAPPIAPVA